MDKTQKFENILKYLKGEIDYDQLGDKLLGGENLDFLKEENYDAYKQEELKCITDPEFYQFLIDNKSLVEAMKEYGDILKKYLNKHKLGGGFVRYDKQSEDLCFCSDIYSDDIHSSSWQLLSDVLR